MEISLLQTDSYISNLFVLFLIKKVKMILVRNEFDIGEESIGSTRSLVLVFLGSLTKRLTSKVD